MLYLPGPAVRPSSVTARAAGCGTRRPRSGRGGGPVRETQKCPSPPSLGPTRSRPRWPPSGRRTDVPAGYRQTAPVVYTLCTVVEVVVGLLCWAAAANLTGLILFPRQPPPPREVMLYGGIRACSWAPCFCSWPPGRHRRRGRPPGVPRVQDSLVELSPGCHRILGWEEIGTPQVIPGLAKGYRFPVPRQKPLCFDFTLPDHDCLAAAISRAALVAALGGEAALAAIPAGRPAAFFPGRRLRAERRATSASPWSGSTCCSCMWGRGSRSPPGPGRGGTWSLAWGSTPKSAATRSSADVPAAVRAPGERQLDDPRRHDVRELSSSPPPTSARCGSTALGLAAVEPDRRGLPPPGARHGGQAGGLECPR